MMLNDINDRGCGHFWVLLIQRQFCQALDFVWSYTQGFLPGSVLSFTVVEKGHVEYVGTSVEL